MSTSLLRRTAANPDHELDRKLDNLEGSRKKSKRLALATEAERAGTGQISKDYVSYNGAEVSTGPKAPDTTKRSRKRQKKAVGQAFGTDDATSAVASTESARTHAATYAPLQEQTGPRTGPASTTSPSSPRSPAPATVVWSSSSEFRPNSLSSQTRATPTTRAANSPAAVATRSNMDRCHTIIRAQPNGCIDRRRGLHQAEPLLSLRTYSS